MDPLIIPVVAILMPIVLVPTILFMKHRHKRREWQHLERMKSLESGFPGQSLAGTLGTGGVATIGAGVPIASVIAALLTCVVSADVTPDDQIPIAGIAWGCSFWISLAAMATSLKLASMQARARKHSESVGFPVDKPAVYDPDAFDVVSSRG
jgi:hypothetical protein